MEISPVDWALKICLELTDSVQDIANSTIKTLCSGFGVLLEGAPRTGKTLFLSNLLHSRFQANEIFTVNRCPRSSFETTSIIHCINTDLNIKVVFIDDIHQIILPAKNQTFLDRQFCILLLRALEQAQKYRGMLIICSCTSSSYSLPSFSALHIKRLLFKNPTHSERVAQLYSTGSFAGYIAKRTSGWNRAEIAALIQTFPPSTSLFNQSILDQCIAEARKHTSLFRESAIVTLVDFDSKDTIQAEEEFSSPNIGGLKKACALLNRIVVQFFTNCSSKSQVSTRGVLLFGESGNGKTLVGLSLGNFVQRVGAANFFCVKCTELVSKIVGETESNVARMFAQARACAPCLLFLDQIDSIAPRRNENDFTTEKTFDRVLSVLLVEMDGILTKDGGGDRVVVLASCRTPQDLEPALVRPGRLGTHIHVGPAESLEEKLALFQVCLQTIPVQVSDGFWHSFILTYLDGSIRRADIANLCREAAMCALRESTNSDHVAERHFVQAINKKF